MGAVKLCRNRGAGGKVHCTCHTHYLLRTMPTAPLRRAELPAASLPDGRRQATKNPELQRQLARVHVRTAYQSSIPAASGSIT